MASSAPWPGVKYSCFLRLTCLLVLFGEGCEQGCSASALESEEVTDLLTTCGAALSDPICEPTFPFPFLEAPCSMMKDSALSRLST